MQPEVLESSEDLSDDCETLRTARCLFPSIMNDRFHSLILVIVFSSAVVSSTCSGQYQHVKLSFEAVRSQTRIQNEIDALHFETEINEPSRCYYGSTATG